MRLFLALVPPPEAVEPLAASVEALRPRAAALRWVPRARWHVTLAFLGEVDAELLPALTRGVLAVAGAHPAPRLRVVGAGHFGTGVLWAGLGGDVGVVSQLAASLGAAARAAGAPVEERPFRAHLTLARSRGATGELATCARALAATAGPAWTASCVHLVRSRLGPEPSYEDLLTAPLGGAVPV